MAEKLKTVNIREKVWRKLVQHCAMNRLKIGEVASDIISEGIEKRSTKK